MFGGANSVRWTRKNARVARLPGLLLLLTQCGTIGLCCFYGNLILINRDKKRWCPSYKTCR